MPSYPSSNDSGYGCSFYYALCRSLIILNVSSMISIKLNPIMIPAPITNKEESGTSNLSVAAGAMPLIESSSN